MNMATVSSTTNCKRNPGSEKTIVRETKTKPTVFTTTTGQAPESSGTIKGKRIFYLANRSTFNRTWLHTTQICIPRCPCPTIWHVYQANVAVEATSMWNMHCPVQREAFQPSDTMRYGISQPPYLQKCAVKCAMSQNYNQSLPTNSQELQLAAKMVQG